MQKKTWEILRKAVNNVKKKDNAIQQIVRNDAVISDKVLMVQEFNTFFTNVANDIVSSIPVSNSTLDDVVSYGSSDKIFKFSDIILSKSEIIEALACLKNKTTLDVGGISSNFIKKIAEPISNPLYIIFSKSMESG
jgi:protein-arginine kinase